MVAHTSDSHRLVDQVARRVQELTCGRIRDLAVEEVQGTVVVRGSVPTHHVRQLALQGALELLSAESCRPLITVG